MKTIVIGGGPAGMIAAITASKNKDKVILIEKNNSLGKKLLITGKGRCNITNAADISEFIEHIPGNGSFVYSVLKNFTNKDIIKILEENGLKVKVERGNRVFPITDNAKDVLDCFTNELKKQDVEIRLNSEVVEIEANKQKEVTGVYLETGELLKASKVILATGGKSYPKTGSNGSGYKLAKKLGHSITNIKPSLVPLIADENLCQNMQGLSLKNVKIKIKDLNKQKIIYEDFGEMLFTHFGVSGPIILSASAILIRYKNIEELLNSNKIKLIIDLKPALSFEELDNRILRDFEKYKNKDFKNSLNDLLPQKMIDCVIELSKIDPNKKVNEITKEERKNLSILLKNFEITIKGFRPIDEAIVTSGGVQTKEINPKTMESKIIKGLFFAGEIIDVDGYTGGFNLQIAYSTGFTAGGNFYV